MRSITSCWQFLQSATKNHVIVLVAAGAYDILPLEPGGSGERYLQESAHRVVGVYSPDVDLATLIEDAAELEAASSQ
jgi:hypothetical protein